MAASRVSNFCGLNVQPSSRYPITIPKPFFDFLPEELILEILKRLPQYLVHRCNCVSKRWLNLISGNNFIRCYIEYNASLPNSKPPFALLYQENNTFRSAFSENPLFKLSGFSFNFLPISLLTPFSNPINLLDSSNGLVLCKSVSQNQYYVCNPLTKKWATVPLPSSSCIYIYSGFVCKSTSNGSSFRLVHISDRNESSLNLAIYNSESRQWAEILFEHVPYVKAMACNGLLHWKREGSIFVYDPFNSRDKNNYKVIRVPEHRSIGHKRCVIGVSNERIRYLEWGSEKSILWELEDYDTEKWRLVCEICFKKMGYPWTKDFSSIKIHPFDEDIVFLRRKDEILWCNMRLEKLVTVCCLAGRCRNSRIFSISLPWWPTAVPLQ